MQFSPKEYGPKKIGSLLEKYQKKLRAPQGTVIETFTKVVTDELGISLDKKYVRYTVHSRTIAVGLAGPFKNEIVLHKEGLLSRCRELLGEKSAPQHII